MKRFFCLITALAMLSFAHQAAAYTLTLNPLTQAIGLTETATVNVDLDLQGTEVLNYFNLNLYFDHTILGFNSFSSLLPTADYDYGFTDNGTSIGFSGINLQNPQSGIFTLATLRFDGNGFGTSPLELSGSLALDDWLETAVSPFSADVGVVPEPATVLMLALGLGAMLFYRKRAQRA